MVFRPSFPSIPTRPSHTAFFRRRPLTRTLRGKHSPRLRFSGNQHPKARFQAATKLPRTVSAQKSAIPFHMKSISAISDRSRANLPRALIFRRAIRPRANRPRPSSRHSIPESGISGSGRPKLSSRCNFYARSRILLPMRLVLPSMLRPATIPKS